MKWKINYFHENQKNEMFQILVKLSINMPEISIMGIKEIITKLKIIITIRTIINLFIHNGINFYKLWINKQKKIDFFLLVNSSNSVNKL